MPAQFSQPTQGAMNDGLAFVQYAANNQQTGSGPRRTTASLAGTPQYAATSFTVSDILQGTFAVKDQSDTMLVVNQALTQDLSGLYSLGADSLSSFSSSPASPLISGGSTTAGTATNSGGFTTSGTIDASWVAALSLENSSTKALLWARKGRASREMHIPVASTISEDIKQHKQYTEMKPEWKHPWDMDRVGGWIGGQDYTPGPLDTGTIGGEDASLPGNRAAFGYLTPEEEQFYCAMAWPFDGTDCNKAFITAGRADIVEKVKGLKKDAYKGRRVLVYSTETQKAVVCTPGDWGPNPYFSNGATSKGSIQGFYIGLSPDVHFALGTDHGTEVQLGWMPDDTPLGPYNAPANSSAGGTNSNRGNDNSTTSADGGGGQNTIEELIYAGNIIANHPNNWMVKSGSYTKAAMALFTEGVTSGFPVEVLYKSSTGKQFLFPSLLNYLYYILEGGFIIDNFLGAIGHKTKAGDPTHTILSNHATGGAIDIGYLGLATEGKTYGYTNANWRTVCDKLFNYLASLPTNIRGQEIGCSFAYDYPNGYHVYKDANPTHLHIGFKIEQAGSLCRALKKTQVSTNPNRIAV